MALLWIEQGSGAGMGALDGQAAATGSRVLGRRLRRRRAQQAAEQAEASQVARSSTPTGGTQGTTKNMPLQAPSCHRHRRGGLLLGRRSLVRARYRPVGRGLAPDWPYLAPQHLIPGRPALETVEQSSAPVAAVAFGGQAAPGSSRPPSSEVLRFHARGLLGLRARGGHQSEGTRAGRNSSSADIQRCHLADNITLSPYQRRATRRRCSAL